MPNPTLRKASRPRIIGIIPARGGSKSIPKKNIARLGRKPLLAYMLNVALESRMLATVVVSSDDDEILAVARRCGKGRKAVCLKRPPELAQDDSPSLPTVKHAVEVMEQAEGAPYDYVVMLQPTTPLLTVEDLDGALRKLVETGADAVMSVNDVTEYHPVKLKRITGDDRLVPYVPSLKEKQFTRQKLDRVYKRNGAIYASRRDVVMRKNQLYGEGKNTRPYVMPPERSVDINHPIDLLHARVIMKHGTSPKK